MEFTKKTLYTIKALVFLNKKEKLVTVTEIVKVAEIPQKFLESIMLELKKSGFIESFHGRAGGYRLLKNLEDIPLKEILDITECKIQLPPKCETNCACKDQIQCKFNQLTHELFSNYLRKTKHLTVADFA